MNILAAPSHWELVHHKDEHNPAFCLTLYLLCGSRLESLRVKMRVLCRPLPPTDRVNNATVRSALWLGFVGEISFFVFLSFFFVFVSFYGLGWLRDACVELSERALYLVWKTRTSGDRVWNTKSRWVSRLGLCRRYVGCVAVVATRAGSKVGVFVFCGVLPLL